MVNKKPTNKEIVAKVEMLTRVNNTLVEMIDNVGDALRKYIEIRNRIKGETNA